LLQSKNSKKPQENSPLKTMNNKKAPEGTISRLFIYLREIAALTKINIHTISSAELGERTNLSDAQVRKDLGYFGQFGVSGAGYDTEELKAALERILGKDKIWNVAVVGVGHLGSALMTYPGFKERGLNIVAGFDSDARKIGKQAGEVVVQSIDELPKVIKDKKISIGVITVPAEDAQDVADKLIKAGVECILNFAPTALTMPENVKVKDVDLSRELETLSYFLVNKKTA
jgi:redox-sensing transcriptional repressor